MPSRRLTPWTDDEIRLVEMWADGLSPKVIALKLNRSVLAVRVHASRLGLVRPGQVKLVQRRPMPSYTHQSEYSPQERACMCCKKRFESKGTWNRICPICKNSEAWQQGFDSYGMSNQR